MSRLNISQNSWHYKVANRYDEYYRNDLCSYIRRIFLSLCITAMLSGVGAMVVGFTVLPTLFYFIAGFGEGIWMDLDVYDIIFGTIIIWMSLMLFFSVKFFTWLHYGKPLAETLPTPFVKLLKENFSWHEKICKRLNYVD
jgi:hypothetical protein